jgi:hypothetical protein
LVRTCKHGGMIGWNLETLIKSIKGCKQDIFYILVTLFSTWKHEKKKNSNFKHSSNISKQMIFFFMGISSLLLAFKSNLCHIIWTWKNTPKVSLIFQGLGMILVMKTNLINTKHYIRMFTTTILRCLKKKSILAKTFHLLSSTWTLFFELPQIWGPNQILASSVKKHDYNKLTFEVHTNKS